jgi:hypothetical protein
VTQTIEIKASSAGKGHIVVGDDQGFIHVLTVINRQLEMMSFIAYDLGVTHLYQLKQHGILVSVGVCTTLICTFTGS